VRTSENLGRLISQRIQEQVIKRINSFQQAAQVASGIFNPSD
jgi:hypothetical protein